MKVLNWLANVLSIGLIIIALFVIVTITLYSGCVDQGYSEAMCKDNLASKVVISSYNYIFR